jgi:hypothetical protein
MPLVGDAVAMMRACLRGQDLRTAAQLLLLVQDQALQCEGAAAASQRAALRVALRCADDVLHAALSLGDTVTAPQVAAYRERLQLALDQPEDVVAAASGTGEGAGLGAGLGAGASAGVAATAAAGTTATSGAGVSARAGAAVATVASAKAPSTPTPVPRDTAAAGTPVPFVAAAGKAAPSVDAVAMGTTIDVTLSPEQYRTPSREPVRTSVSTVSPSAMSDTVRTSTGARTPTDTSPSSSLFSPYSVDDGGGLAPFRSMSSMSSSSRHRSPTPIQPGNLFSEDTLRSLLSQPNAGRSLSSSSLHQQGSGDATMTSPLSSGVAAVAADGGVVSPRSVAARGGDSGVTRVRRVPGGLKLLRKSSFGMAPPDAPLSR